MAKAPLNAAGQFESAGCGGTQPTISNARTQPNPAPCALTLYPVWVPKRQITPLHCRERSRKATSTMGCLPALVSLLWLSLLSAHASSPLTQTGIGPALSTNQIEIAGGTDENQEM